MKKYIALAVLLLGITGAGILKSDVLEGEWGIIQSSSGPTGTATGTVDLDGRTEILSASGKTYIKGDRADSVTDDTVSLWVNDLRSIIVNTAGNVRARLGLTADSITTSGNANLSLTPNGTGIIVPTARIANASAATILGTAVTPTANAAGDVATGGAFQAATLRSAGAITLGEGWYLTTAGANSSLIMPSVSYQSLSPMVLATHANNRNILITTRDAYSNNTRIPLSANPTMVWQSSLMNYKNNRIGLISHDGTNFALETYTGGVSIGQRASYADGWFLIAGTGIPVAGETFTIGADTYTFQATCTNAFEVCIGTTIATTVANMVAEIEAHDTQTVNSYNNSPYVYIRKNETGTAGNAMTLTESATNVTVSSATLTDGQAAATGLALYGNYLETGTTSVGACRLTTNGSYATLLKNSSAAASMVAGTLVIADSATDDSVIIAPADSAKSIGVVLAAPAARGSLIWIQTTGRAAVQSKNSTACIRGNICDVSDVAGRADCSADASARSIGSCLQTIASPSNQQCTIALNFQPF